MRIFHIWNWKQLDSVRKHEISTDEQMPTTWIISPLWEGSLNPGLELAGPTCHWL